MPSPSSTDRGAAAPPRGGGLTPRMIPAHVRDSPSVMRASGTSWLRSSWREAGAAARPRRCRARAWRGAWRAAGRCPSRTGAACRGPAPTAAAAGVASTAVMPLLAMGTRLPRVPHHAIKRPVSGRPHYLEGVSMAQRCDICGKGPSVGHKISHAHNVTNRRWLPTSRPCGHGRRNGQAPAGVHALSQGREGRQGRLDRPGNRATGGITPPRRGLEAGDFSCRREAATPHRSEQKHLLLLLLLGRLLLRHELSPPFDFASADLRVAPNGARRSPYLRLPVFFTATSSSPPSSSPSSSPCLAHPLPESVLKPPAPHGPQ